MEQAKAGLKEEGYALSEINKYSLNNWGKVLHAIYRNSTKKKKNAVHLN
jgi:hypothetical protein